MSYYAEDSGVGLALDNCCGARPRRIGVVGLGAGTLAAYGRPGDTIEFYEINPLDEDVAREVFTYLRDSKATVKIVTGDARISLAHQPPQGFDVLVVDAFSGDAIPVHLLTAEAMTLYRRHLAPGGVIAFHVSNQYLDLAPVIGRLAEANGMEAQEVHTAANDARGEMQAAWVLVSTRREFFDAPEIERAGVPVAASGALWTDDYSSLLPLVRWNLGEVKGH
jgi:spermidine synthase